MARKPPSAVLAVVLLLLVILLVTANWWLIHPLENRGTFGDMFGAANALFTGLAFAAVIYAILLQRYEVSLLKEELNRSKTLLEKQQASAEKQMTLQNTQQFEATFFNLLRVFTDLVEAMDLRKQSNVTAKGKDVFPIFLKRIRENPDFRASNRYPNTPRTTWSEDAYEAFYESHKSELGHYFRTLYNLVKFVDQSEVSEKRVYTNLIRAQLSDDEATLLFLNGLTERGRKFKPLLEKYSMLKNVDLQDTLYKDARGKESFSPTAFS